MTIRPGEPWGEVVDRPAPRASTVAADDAAAAAVIAGAATVDVVITGGDFVRTVGRASSGEAVRRYPVDVLRVDADGRPWTALAHVVVRRRGPLGWWWGPLRAVMNVGTMGPWDVAPRAHPNDGRLDVVEVDAAMSVRARRQARRRLRTGTHIPHPAISMKRPTSVSWRFDEPLGLWIDGVAQGRVRALDVRVDPDAAVVHV